MKYLINNEVDDVIYILDLLIMCGDIVEQSRSCQNHRFGEILMAFLHVTRLPGLAKNGHLFRKYSPHLQFFF